MNYLRDFRGDAREVYKKEGIDAVIAFSAERILESYKNGLKAARQGSKKPSSEK